MYIVLRRLLRNNLGSLSPNTRCPVGFCRSSIDANHLESCTGSRIKSNRSDVFKAVVVEMLVDVGVSFDQCDCKHNFLLTTRLEIAGAVNTSGERVTTAQGASRVVDGADMLVRGLFIPGEETVIDFTVFSERAEKRVDASMVDPSHVFVNPSFSLADVEENKVVQYKRMYSAINVKVLGLAMNLAGGVGPTLLRVIRRCSEIAGGRVPVWANWTAATTFVGAWVQRMVSAVQVKNAQCVIAARSRVGAVVAASLDVIPRYV